jgi:Pectinacetylesterase
VRRSLLPVAAALVLVGSAACAGSDDGDEAGAPLATGWERVEPGGDTRCARGGKYAFWVRKGDPEKLLVFFQGGGGCFDVTTCEPGSFWFDDRVDGGDDPELSAGGVLDLEAPENPFADYSMVFIPSCTGDVHTGSRVVEYGPYRVHQKGHLNATAALEHAFEEFPSPEAVFVTGCSAGSVGSAFHADTVLQQYPDARVTQVGDSLAFVFHRPVSLESWGTHEHFPEWFTPSRKNGRWTMTEFLTALAEQYPERTFGRFNHVADLEQEAFYQAVGGDPGGFTPGLRAAETELTELPNYRSFLACGGEHCSLDRSRFFEEEVEGTRLRDWVADLEAGEEVDCPECRP